MHARNVLHFLTGAQVRQGMESIAHWLAPGGRVFIQASTPWQAPWREFVEVFEGRRRAGVEWPGWMEDTREFSTHRKLSQIPGSLHLLDEGTLRRECEAAGLEVLDALVVPAAGFVGELVSGWADARGWWRRSDQGMGQRTA